MQHAGTALLPSTELKDEPYTVKVGNTSWSPRNHDHAFHGDVTLREVLEQSINVPTARLVMETGLTSVYV